MTNPPRNLQTIESHVLDLQRLHPSASGDFTSLLNDISFAAKVVNAEVNKAGLVDILGATGAQNIQGEYVQKLDDYANNVFLKCMGTRGQVCIYGSEELEDPVFVEPDMGIEVVANLMVDKGFHTLPVVDKGRLVGIIGKEDILKTLMPGNRDD